MHLDKKTIKSQLNSELAKDKIDINLHQLQDIVNFCFHNVIFDFTSQIDDILIKIANQNIINLEKDFIPNTFLHVFSQVYLDGGHTRVGERWIKYSPNSEKHSVVITKQDFMPIPKLLIQVVEEKNGDFIVFDQKPAIELALQLREMASKYEFIILHIHMNDLIPVLAFGARNFNRKILFFNHADHEFWIGAKIATLIINFRSIAIKINEKYRNAYNNALLPLIIDEPNLSAKEKHIVDLKKSLKIDNYDKFIITLASEYKYQKFDNYNWLATAKNILNQNQNCVILAIGPSMKNIEWSNAYQETNQRIIPLGIIPNNEVEKYLQIADLAIDSYPFSSFTALLDLAKYNIECLSLKTPINDLDSLFDAKIYCKDQEELVEKATKILQNTKKDDNYKTKLYDIIRNKHFPNAFRKNITSIYKMVQENDICKKQYFSLYSFKIKSANIKYFVDFNCKMKGIKRDYVYQKSFISKFKKSCIKRMQEIKSLINK